MYKHDLCGRAVAVRPSVCLSRPCILSKRVPKYRSASLQLCRRMLCSVAGKVHRDLKLENILLSRTEENIEDICIKVLNFDSLMPHWLHFVKIFRVSASETERILDIALD